MNDQSKLLQLVDVVVFSIMQFGGKLEAMKYTPNKQTQLETSQFYCLLSYMFVEQS